MKIWRRFQAKKKLNIISKDGFKQNKSGTGGKGQYLRMVHAFKQNITKEEYERMFSNTLNLGIGTLGWHINITDLGMVHILEWFKHIKLGNNLRIVSNNNLGGEIP